MAFLGLGNAELIIIGLVVVLLFGASQIPKLARSLGHARAEFGRARREFESEAAKGEAAAAAPAGASDEQVRATARSLGIEEQGRSVGELKLLIQQRLG